METTMQTEFFSRAVALNQNHGWVMVPIRIVRRIITVMALTFPQSLIADTACPDYPAPVTLLEFGSPYRADSENRNELDPEAKAAVEAALAPTDDFIRFLARTHETKLEYLNAPIPDPVTAQLAQDCIVQALLDWASVASLTNLVTFEANLTFGARLAGIAITYGRIRDDIDDEVAKLIIDSWLKSMAWRHVVFWEAQATRGARRGNLRAWSGLAFVTVGLAVGDESLVHLGAASSEFVLCTANSDGSLPQEMIRGKYALHYQIHALTALVTTAAYLRHMTPEDLRRDMTLLCDGALGRAVEFALNDLESGEASLNHSGHVQNFFDGSGVVRPFMLAWLPAARSLGLEPRFPSSLIEMENTYNSKLGGNQDQIWISNIE